MSAINQEFSDLFQEIIRNDEVSYSIPPILINVSIDDKFDIEVSKHEFPSYTSYYLWVRLKKKDFRKYIGMLQDGSMIWKFQKYSFMFEQKINKILAVLELMDK